MMTREDRNRPIDDVEDPELLEDIDPEPAEADSIHGGEGLSPEDQIAGLASSRPRRLK